MVRILGSISVVAIGISLDHNQRQNEKREIPINFFQRMVAALIKKCEELGSPAIGGHVSVVAHCDSLTMLGMGVPRKQIAKRSGSTGSCGGPLTHEVHVNSLNQPLPSCRLLLKGNFVPDPSRLHFQQSLR